MAYYKVIQKVRYAADLLNLAESFDQEAITLENAGTLFNKAMDGGKITEIERRTLLYILDRHPFAPEAAQWLQTQLGTGENTLEDTIRRVIRLEYNLTNLDWKIDPEMVRARLQKNGARPFREILKSALEAYLHWSQGPLSFAGCVGRRDLAFVDPNQSGNLLKNYLDRGVLQLLPEQSENPDYWVFDFQTPDFKYLNFHAFVHESQNQQYSKGSFDAAAPHAPMCASIVVQHARLPQMEWLIPEDEVKQQLALVPGQNFGNVLFAALTDGIYNAESSFSFHDFITQDVWVDPELGVQAYERAYAQRGKLHLIPLDYKAQADAGTDSFPVPENASFSIDSEWGFGLEMPEKTNFKVLITVPRENTDGDAAWNTCFIDEELPLSEQVMLVIAREFKLDGLQWSLPEEDVLKQQTQFGPDWRSIPSLFRQALNTVLHDYLTPKSVFNFMAQKLSESTPASDFDDPQEYRAAIAHAIFAHLNHATLNLLPIEMEDNNPINGEKIEENWLFYLDLPQLHSVGFWVVIPRWPDDLQQAYTYGDF